MFSCSFLVRQKPDSLLIILSIFLLPLSDHFFNLREHSLDLVDLPRNQVRVPNVDQNNDPFLFLWHVSRLVLIWIIKNDHFAFLPRSWVTCYSQKRLFWYKKREMTPEFEIARSIVWCNRGLWRHSWIESVTKGSVSHQLRSYAFLQ